MGRYERARATASLARARIAQCTKGAISRRPAESRELKAARKAGAQARKARRKLKAHYLSADRQLRPPATRDLARPRRGKGWKCKCCRQMVTEATPLTAIKQWLEQPCRGPPPAAGRCVSFNGVESHPSHPLRWLPSQQKWFCTQCAASATELVSAKLQTTCGEYPSCNSMRYKLKD